MKSLVQISSFKHSNLIKVSMKVKLIWVVFIGMGLNACQNTNKNQTQAITEKEPDVLGKSNSTETTQSKEVSYALALSQNALQIVNQNTGSTREIGFDMNLNKTVEIIGKVLKSKPIININYECGAGPLKMAAWDNGLTLLFKQKKNDWIFVGWAANKPKNPELKINTMAGIGIGSTRKEMESAYIIKVMKTSLGYEFSTKTNNLFGIFDGADGKAKITNLWSGTSCNFR